MGSAVVAADTVQASVLALVAMAVLLLVNEGEKDRIDSGRRRKLSSVIVQQQKQPMYNSSSSCWGRRGSVAELLTLRLIADSKSGRRGHLEE